VAVANQRHVDILVRDGVRVWNLWRKEESAIRPDLSEANLSEANLRGANLSGAALSRVALGKTDLGRASLRGSDLREAVLQEADLGKADLSGAAFSRADLRGADLTGADLTGADLSEADLSEADLTGADLSEADLSEANLFKAILFEADLTGADLSGANLGRANLRKASLSGADLFEADLFEADLNCANLSRALCHRTSFYRASLTGCTIYGISAWDVDLDYAIQADLRITLPKQATNITVDNLEVAHFLDLLLHNRKVRSLLDTITSKVVLILGHVTDDGKPALDAVREALREHPNGYIPVLFDIEPQRDKPDLETVGTLANLARFVIADLTDPQMVRSELTYMIPSVPTVPVQPIMQGDADLPPEYATWALYPSFLPVYRYADLSHLFASLIEAVIVPVEAHVVARRLADSDSHDASS
jgi:uncharacterized protein YjbI with pentapeptide repeats